MFFGLGHKVLPFKVPHKGHLIEDLTLKKMIYGHEPATFKFFERKLKATDKVADVGAHNGIFTTFFSDRCAEVSAYEPDPVSYKKLLAATKKLKNVKVFNQAVSNTEGVVTLGGKPGSGLNSLLYGEDKGVEKVTSVCLTEKFNWIKIDVEGAELNVLEGLKEPTNCTIEFSPRNIEEIGMNPKMYLEKACSYGYDWFAIDSDGVEYETSVEDLLAKVSGHTNLYLRPRTFN